jgi:MFS family permease
MGDIVKKYSLTPEAFGQFSGVYYLGYSLAHVPIGIALDRIGPKRTVPIFVLMTALGIVPLMLSEVWSFSILGRIIMGIGSSGAILSVFKVVQVAFEEKKFSRVLSFSVTVGLLGAIYGGAPIHLLREKFGFESILAGLVIVGIALSLLAFFVIPSHRSSTRATSVISDFKLLFGNREVVYLCILAGLMVGPLEGFADVWGTQYLKVNYGLDTGVAAAMPSFIFLGMCFGGPVLCYLAEQKNRHLEVVLGSALAMAGVFASMLSFRLSTSLLTPLFLIVGMCCAYQILMIYKISTLVGPNLTGMASAVANMMIMIFGYVFHSSMGWLIGVFGGFEDARSLSIGVAIIPVSLFVSALGLASYILSKKSNDNLIRKALVD